MFINLDPEVRAARRLSSAKLTEQFARWPLEQRYKQAHVAKILRCNWKVAQEAFMEAYHVVATHPQLLPGIGDANSQYDVFGQLQPRHHAQRHAQPAPSVEADASRRCSTRWSIAASTSHPLVDDPGGHDGAPDCRERRSRDAPARARRSGRRAVRRRTGRQLLLHGVPELPSVGRVQPHRLSLPAVRRPTSTNRSWSACTSRRFRRASGRPSAPIHWLGPDDDWTEAPELGFLARVFNQDTFNLPKVQLGLKTTAKKTVTLANYQETKLRHFHHLLDQWIARP